MNIKDIPVRTAGINTSLTSGSITSLFGMIMIDEIVERCPGLLGIPRTASTTDVRVYQDWVKQLTSSVEDINFDMFIKALNESKDVAKTLNKEMSDPTIELPMEMATGYMSFCDKAAKINDENQENFVELHKEKSKEIIEGTINFAEKLFELDEIIEESQHELIEAIDKAVNKTINHTKVLQNKIKMIKPYENPDIKSRKRIFKNALKAAKTNIKNI